MTEHFSLPDAVDAVAVRAGGALCSVLRFCGVGLRIDYRKVPVHLDCLCVLIFRGGLDTDLTGDARLAADLSGNRSEVLVLAVDERVVADRMQFNKVSRTGANAVTAGGALFRVHVRNVTLAQVYGVEGAAGNAAAHANAAVLAALAHVLGVDRCGAVHEAPVLTGKLCRLVCPLAEDNRNQFLLLLSGYLDAHHVGHRCGGLGSADHAEVELFALPGDCLSVESAASVAAPTAVHTGKNLFHLRELGVYLNCELSVGNDEKYGKEQTECAHQGYCCSNHGDLLFFRTMSGR